MTSPIERRFDGAGWRRFAGLLRLELRALGGIGLSVAALVGVSAGLTLYAVPVVLGVGGVAFWNLVSALALVCGLPLVAQTFEADWRTGTAGTLRVAPVSRWSVVGAKALAVALWLGTCWCVLVPACWIGLELSPDPSGSDAIVLTGVFEEKDFWRARNAFAVMAYAGTAALSLVFRHALAATLGGLMTVGLPWLCVAALADVSNPVALFGLTCVAASWFVASHPVGTVVTLAALSSGFFLRGRAARSIVRRGASVLALLVALVAVTPAFLIAENALEEHRFDDPDSHLDSVELNPVTGSVMVTTRGSTRLGSRATMWLLDPTTGDARHLPGPVQGLLSVLPGFPPYIGGGWTSDGGRFIGVLQLNSAGNRNAFFSLDPAQGTIRATDKADYARELCYGGWDLDRVPGESGKQTRISRPGVEPFEFDARRLRAFPSLRPNLVFYVGRDDRVHCVDTTTRDDRILDMEAPGDSLPLDVSPDGRWLVVRKKAPKTARLIEVETGRSRVLPSWSYSWTMRDLPILVDTPGGSKGSWTLFGLDAEETLEIDLGDTWAPRDIDGTHWLIRTNRSGLYTVDATGRVVRELRRER